MKLGITLEQAPPLECHRGCRFLSKQPIFLFPYRLLLSITSLWRFRDLFDLPKDEIKVIPRVLFDFDFGLARMTQCPS